MIGEQRGALQFVIIRLDCTVQYNLGCCTVCLLTQMATPKNSHFLLVKAYHNLFVTRFCLQNTGDDSTLLDILYCNKYSCIPVVE